MSRATSLVSVAQQLSISAGVAIGALVVELSMKFHGGSAIMAADFQPAFLVVGAIAASSVIVFLTLPHDAGAAMANREPIAAPDASDQRVGVRAGNPSPADKARQNPHGSPAGFTCFTLAKSRFRSASSVASVPPWITLDEERTTRPQHLAGEFGAPPRPAP